MRKGAKKQSFLQQNLPDTMSGTSNAIVWLTGNSLWKDSVGEPQIGISQCDYITSRVINR